MDYHIIEARYVGGHVVWLRFRDGTAGEIDLKSALQGPIFEPLRDPTALVLQQSPRNCEKRVRQQMTSGLACDRWPPRALWGTL